RRRVLAAVTGAGAVACVALALASVNEPVQLAGLGLVFGSVSLPIYALCVAHVNDNVADDEFVETASGVLMMNSIGSMVGPTVAAPAMSRWGPDALFAVAGVFLGAAFVWTLSRLRVDRQRAFFDPFFPLAQTSQSAIDLVAEASHEPDGGTGQARVPLAMAPVSVGRGIGGTREESVR
ncbi:MAG: hypothetical protein R3190_17085, partial [Thermoanaerobaculia bacterium]|nr:hypothetical protein [Thermoanaerobaculia bacterium]